MEFNRRAHPECVYASNPYHECAGGCLERIAQGKGTKEKKKPGSKLLSLSGSFGRKKAEPDSQTKPYQNGHLPKAAHPNKYPSSPQDHLKKNLAAKKEESSSSSSLEHSGGPYGQKGSFDLDQDLISKTMPLFAIKTPEREQVTKPTPIKQEDEAKNVAPTELTEENRSFSFLSVGQSNGNSDSDEDVDSVFSESVVSVGKYRVRSDVSSILQSIIAKHGDIAANCQLMSASMRARYLECLCLVVQELKSTAFEDLTKPKVKEMLAVVKDVESVKIDAAWLRGILEELFEAIETQSQLQAVEEQKANHEHALDATREELESCVKELAEREKEVAEAKALVDAMSARLSELELEVSKYGETVSDYKSKVDKFRGKSVIDEIL